MTSLIHGGQQEFGYRAGTHAVHNIVGFGKACEIAKRDMDNYIEKILNLEEETKKLLKEKYPEIEFLGDLENKIPGVIGMIIPNVINEMLIKNLADKVAISAGSACGIGEPSYVIQEIGKANCTNHFIRISLNKSSCINYISKLTI